MSARRHPASTPGVVFTPPDLARELARELDGRLPQGRAPRVLDPACGEGALLAAALQRRGCDPVFARTSLFGIELDPELAERSRARLRALAGLPRGTELDQHVVCADALAPDRPWPERTHVLANPPWVSFSGRRSAGASRTHPMHSGHPTHPMQTAGWPSLHGRFLTRIARHVGTEGTLAQLIVPAQVTELERYGPLRRAVTEHARLALAPRELGEDRFADVIGPAVVLGLEPAGRGPGRPEPDEAPWCAPAGDTAGLRAALERFPRLDRPAFADPGVHTGNAARELVFDAPGSGRAPLRVGRDLVAYRLGAPSRFLRTDLTPAPGRASAGGATGLRFRIAPLERYAGFPVLVRQTADRPLAALHLEPTYFRNSLLAARAVEGLDPAFVVGVLNGPVAAAWHRIAWRDARQRAFPQVKVRHLVSQPFPIAARSERPALHDELAERVRALAGLDGAAFERGRREAEALALAAFDLPHELRGEVLRIASSRLSE